MGVARNTPDVFWSRVRVLSDTECWEWMGCRNCHGYGRFCYKASMWLAHRLVWTWERGDIPDNLCVLHRCDNPPCCNPNHLFLGTYSDNNQDKAAKGRAKSPCLSGETHGRAKVTDSQVLTMRELHKSGLFLHRELAERYGISKSQVGNILSENQRQKEKMRESNTG